MAFSSPVNLPFFALCVAASLAGSKAHAEEIRFQFAGVVISASSPHVGTGAPVSGWFMYDTDALPSRPPLVFDDGQWVSYALPQPVALGVSVGDVALSVDSATVALYDDFANAGPQGDDVMHVFTKGVRLNGVPSELAAFSLSFASRPGDTSAFDGTLPASFDLGRVEGYGSLGEVAMDWDMSERYDGPAFSFRITSISAVPEPSTLLTGLVGLGLLGCVLNRRRDH
jgi:hypothetical protein